MIDDPYLARAREFERLTRHALSDGCSADIAILDRLCADAFANARAALQEALHSVDLGPSGKRGQLLERAQLIAADCTRRVRDTANVRFRARFRSYAEAVWENEARLTARPRRIALPRLHLRAVEPKIVLGARPEAIVEAWMGDLTAQLRDALRDAVATAIETVTRRLIASVARSRTAHALFTQRSMSS